jgi:hypothetical protein
MVDETKKKRIPKGKKITISTMEDRTPGSDNYSGFLQSGLKANVGSTPKKPLTKKISDKVKSKITAMIETMDMGSIDSAKLKKILKESGYDNISDVETAEELGTMYDYAKGRKKSIGAQKMSEMKDGGAVRKGDSETVKMYKHGGEVKSKKSKVAGRLAQRGYGKARK